VKDVFHKLENSDEDMLEEIYASPVFDRQLNPHGNRHTQAFLSLYLSRFWLQQKLDITENSL